MVFFFIYNSPIKSKIMVFFVLNQAGEQNKSFQNVSL